ncbi:hypothetical protein [Pacificoceanicola onchidii]|uniref:hypothetical protein n=1 Tax=Pacificoceanicola onchidii TaxID=2562685 RepID=UPI0010A61806|nr:hypothetical protein [Pacificoceanicola onchidii]
MERFDREAPLPAQMQGRWVEAEDSASELIIEGGDILCFGAAVAYDYKLMGEDDGAVVVSLRVEDDAQDDAFQRANITELVLTPDGEFHAYNVKFSSQFVRSAGGGA